MGLDGIGYLILLWHQEHRSRAMLIRCAHAHCSMKTFRRNFQGINLKPLVRGRKSQLYPSASKSRKGRVFAVFWWKLYVTRILSWRGDWRAAIQVLNLQPHLLLPLSLSHLPAPPPTPLFWDLLFNYFPPFSIQTLSWNFQGMEIFHK